MELDKDINGIVVNATSDVKFLDKKDEELRLLIFRRFMRQQEIKFINRFYFEGDEAFTMEQQRTLFRAVFRNGSAAIHNPLKGFDVEGEINKIPEMTLFKPYDSGFKEQVKDFIDKYRIAVMSQTTIYDSNGRPSMGIGITDWLHNRDKKAFKLTTDNTAWLQFNDFIESGYMAWFVWGYLYSSAVAIYKRRLFLTDIKFIANTANNSNDAYYENIFNSLFSLEKRYINMRGQNNTQSSIDNYTSPDDILGGSLQILSTLRETPINDLQEQIDKIANMANTVMGTRVNNHKKQEKNIMEEFSADEMNNFLLESDYKAQVEMFITSYNRVYGVELKLVDRVEEKQKEIEEKQVKLASGGGATMEKETGKDINKDDKGKTAKS